MNTADAYEIVVGLEVHARLLTASKLFCGDSAAFGAEPNTHVSPITLAHPGTLPKMNSQAIESAIKMGLACHCRIEQENYFARKNYFYPDLPKGYQVSQHTTPICEGGHVTIRTSAGEKNVRLNRIHLEEDAGKSLHDIDPENTCIDLNRAGTPLIEIVTEPDIRSAEEAFAYVTEVRKLVQYLGVCDGNMEEGSLRCDANISVRKKGDTKLGTRVEVKNLNSVRNIKRAVEYEAARLIQMCEAGETIRQQTRSFDAGNGTTFAIRDKEDADDYRYFPEPDLTPFSLTDDFIDTIRSSLPELPAARIQRYMGQLQIPEYDVRVITEEKEFADYFEAVIQQTTYYKQAANWMLGPVKNWLNDKQCTITDFPLKPAALASLITITAENKVSFSQASGKLFALLTGQPDADPLLLAEKNNLLQDSDAAGIEAFVDQAIAKFPDKVAEYRKGKKGLLALFVGEVMKLSKGKADPKMTNELVTKKLKSES